MEEEKNFIRALKKLDSRAEVLAAKDISDFRLVVVCAAIFLCGFGRRNQMQSFTATIEKLKRCPFTRNYDVVVVVFLS